MRRTRETFRPSSHHDADTMWVVRYGEELSRRHQISGRRLRLEIVSPATLVAIKTADTYAEQYRADDEKRWNDSASLGEATIHLARAYTALAVVEGRPLVVDGEPQNGAEVR
jgi:hypothetical protein